MNFYNISFVYIEYLCVSCGAKDMNTNNNDPTLTFPADKSENIVWFHRCMNY